MKTLVLASSSPYRRALMEKLGLPFLWEAPEIDESPRRGEMPIQMANRLAEEKCRALAQRYPAHLIIGSDQVAMLGDRQLTKPGTRANAIEQLENSSGRFIVFHTAICLMDSGSGRLETACDRCAVHVRRLSRTQIEHYVDRDRPFDCAGAFKSEGLGIALFERIEGDDPNALIGLPLIRLVGLLEKFGIDIFKDPECSTPPSAGDV